MELAHCPHVLLILPREALPLRRVFTPGQSFDSICQRQPIFMTEQPPIVFVVDDDASIRDALKSLIRSVV
jgi:hypothetical protein